MTDTHTHIYMPDAFPGNEGSDAVQRAIDNGVDRLIFPCVDTESVKPMVELYSRFPDNIYLTIGLHPTEVTSDWKTEFDNMGAILSAYPVVALGEVGLDLHWDKSTLPLQIEALKYQIDYASAHALPLIIHQRDALEPLLELFASTDLAKIPAILFHCFTESEASVQRIRKCVPDAYFGIGGVVTFKNAANLRKALHEIGIDRIVLETDAPWLAPVPQRGKRNESSYIPLIAQNVADELGITINEVIQKTDANATTLFGMPRSLK